MIAVALDPVGVLREEKLDDEVGEVNHSQRKTMRYRDNILILIFVHVCFINPLLVPETRRTAKIDRWWDLNGPRGPFKRPRLVAHAHHIRCW